MVPPVVKILSRMIDLLNIFYTQSLRLTLDLYIVSTHKWQIVVQTKAAVSVNRRRSYATSEKA